MSIVPGRDVPAVPQAWVDAVNQAINDANHDDLCGCRAWPDGCDNYKPGQWDIGVDLHIAVGALAPFMRELESQRGDHWKRVAVEMEQDRDRLRAELDRARRLRLARPSAAVDPAVHTPQRVRAYLAAGGWEVAEGGRVAELWHLAALPDRQLLVPLIPSAPDYAKVLGILASDLAERYSVGELRVLADIEAAADA